MAVKTTYIYRVEFRNNDELKETRFCYARNASVIKEEYRNLCKEYKYNHMDIIVFGAANIKKHPGPFEEMPQDEVNYLLSNNLGTANAYSNRKDNKGIPQDAMFVPADQIGAYI